MTPMQKMMEAGKYVDTILDVSNKLSDELVDAIETISKYDIDEIKKISDAVETIDKNKKNIQIVENGLHYIKDAIKIQDKITYVSDIRDSIGLVAGNIENIEKVAKELENARPILAMKPMIEETLSMSEKIDSVLDIKKDMEDFIQASESIEYATSESFNNVVKSEATLKKIEEVYSQIVRMDRNINKKLADINDKISKLENLSIKVKHLKHDEKPYSSYDRESSVLEIGIPSGKPGPRGKYKGDKGDPGRDGKDFAPSYMGKLFERSRYDNYPAGISFLSLDEVPTMIYFKKSHALGDWTEGQPFGYTEGFDKIEVANSKRLGGYTVNELLEHIRQKMTGE